MFLFRLLALPVTEPTNGLMAIFRLIRDEVDKEHANPEVLKQQLAQLQRMLDNGEIDEDIYEELEEEILDKLDEIYEMQENS